MRESSPTSGSPPALLSSAILAYTAWIDSAKPVPPLKAEDQPQNPDNPRYNPAAGSAPAPDHSR
jgi:hypothetical protein